MMIYYNIYGMEEREREDKRISCDLLMYIITFLIIYYNIYDMRERETYNNAYFLNAYFENNYKQNATGKTSVGYFLN